MNRRDFLKAGAVLGSGLIVPRRAMALPNITGLVTMNISCFQPMVLGYCYCGYVPCGYLIRHFLPAAYVECIKADGDTVMGGAGSPAMATRITEPDAQAFEVRVYEITDTARTTAFNVKSVCLCSGEYAKAEGVAKNVMPSALASMTNATGCGITDALLKQAISRMAGAVGTGLLKLVYTTETDPVNWRTGCRDLAIAQATAAAGPLCAASAIDDALGTGIAAQTPMGQICVGTWGTVFPRQMMQQGVTELVGASLAAYRALHIAAITLNTLQFEVSLACKLQPVIPVISNCYAPGAPPAIVDLTATVNPTGSYGFIWWVPVVCCKSFQEAAACGF